MRGPSALRSRSQRRLPILHPSPIPNPPSSPGGRCPSPVSYRHGPHPSRASRVPVRAPAQQPRSDRRTPADAARPRSARSVPFGMAAIATYRDRLHRTNSRVSPARSSLLAFARSVALTFRELPRVQGAKAPGIRDVLTAWHGSLEWAGDAGLPRQAPPHVACRATARPGRPLAVERVEPRASGPGMSPPRRHSSSADPARSPRHDVARAAALMPSIMAR
jgi:hypothetical protein